MTSKPLVRRTRHTLRSAELGFLGVVVYTRVHTPRRCGQFCSAGTSLFSTIRLRDLRTSWLIVAIYLLHCCLSTRKNGQIKFSQNQGYKSLMRLLYPVKLITTLFTEQ